MVIGHDARRLARALWRALKAATIVTVITLLVIFVFGLASMGLRWLGVPEPLDTFILIAAGVFAFVFVTSWLEN